MSHPERRSDDMKTSLLIASALALGAGPVAQAAEIDGNWARSDGKAHVRIARCGADICATNTWIKPGTPSEKAGDVLVMTIEKVSDGRYSGSAFDPQRDMRYKITLDVGAGKMTSRGCMLGGLLCRAVGWTRID
jgi:uncharacterized protein (DUF2147 family)